MYIEARENEKRNPTLNCYGEGRVMYMPYIMSIYAYTPEWILDYPQDDELKTMSIDIEVATNGNRFPLAEHDPILMIGAKVNGEDVKIFESSKDSWQDDSKILEEFATWYAEKNPDVIATYNGTKFDIPYICKRMQINGMNPVSLSRVVDKTERRDSEGNTIFLIHGRAHMDLLNSVKADQKLTGNIKDRGLKTVAEWFGIKAIKFGDEINNTIDHIGTDKFREYLISDVNATDEILKIYLPLQISLAEYMKIPLKDVVEAPPSYLPTLVMARDMIKRKIIPLEDINSRYASVLQETSGNLYEGAIVQLRQKGLFEWVTKIDFASMYPSAMQTLNLSPDTCKMVAFHQLDPMIPIMDQYRFSYNDDQLTLLIPDMNLKRLCEIQISRKRTGFLTEFISNSKKRRKEIRAQMIHATSEEKLILDSRQNAVKVLMNSMYGINGQGDRRWADLAISVATTGICRWITTRVLEWIDKNYRRTQVAINVPEFKEYTGCIIEVDTDGIIVSERIDIDKLNTYLDELVLHTFGMENYLHLEEESFGEKGSGGRCFMYKQKNYIVSNPQTPTGIIIHGAAFKSSGKSRIYDNARQVITTALIKNSKSKEETAREIEAFLDTIDTYPMSSFCMSVRIGKSEKEYASQSALPVKLAQDYEKRMGIYPDLDTQLRYVKTKTGYKLILADDNLENTELDYSYYKEDIMNLAIDIFGLDLNVHSNDQISLF